MPMTSGVANGTGSEMCCCARKVRTAATFSGASTLMDRICRLFERKSAESFWIEISCFVELSAACAQKARSEGSPRKDLRDCDWAERSGKEKSGAGSGSRSQVSDEPASRTESVLTEPSE